MLNPELKELLKEEEARIKDGINLIASENYPSKDVSALVGSVFMSKYAEGVPGKRFYSGCKIVDKVEELANNLAKELFAAEHANLQPHSGSQANQAIFKALLKPGDKVLAMAFDAGGHLTHGHKLNSSGELYNFDFYTVDKTTETIDYNALEEKAVQIKPKIILAGGSSYSRLIDFKKIKEVANKIGAIFFVDMAHFAGLVAAKVIESPVQYADVISSTTHKTLRGPRGGMILCKKEFASMIDKAVMPGIQGGPAINSIAAKGQCFWEAMQPDYKIYQESVVNNAQIMAKRFIENGFRVVSSGTDTHLFLIDTTSMLSLKPEQRNGAFVAALLEKNSIFVNKNMIPFDKLSPMVTSGIRIGTPAITTLGASGNRVIEIADLISGLITKQQFD